MSVSEITIPANQVADQVANTVPRCSGTEANIMSCLSENKNLTTGEDVLCKTDIMCFVNNTTPNLCFNLTTSPPPPSSTGTPHDTSSTNDIPETLSNTTLREQTTSTPSIAGGTESSFLTTPVGIGVIVVITVVIIFFLALFIVIVFVLCRRSPVKAREHSRVSPQNVYYDDDSMKADEDGKPFNNSPDQRRRVSENVVVTTEHHLLEQSPLYEQLKDVAPPSVSSHDSGRSTDTSDINPPPTLYSTLERDKTLPPPTYSTLDRAQSDYAQVEPFINNGSLTRGATLTSPVSDDVYHTLDRTTSQSSYTRDFNRAAGNSSPKTSRVVSKPNSSPKQTPRNALPSISDSAEAPTYAILEEAIDEASMISTNAVVSQRFSPHHSPAIRHSPRHSPAIRHSPRHSPAARRHSPAGTRHSPITRHSPGHHRGLQHTMSQTRPPTHEHTALANKQKSSTLPNSGRSAPTLPHTRQRHSNYIEEPISNDVDTFVDSRFTASTQNNTFTSWV